MNRTITRLGLAVLLLLTSGKLSAQQKGDPSGDIDQTWQNGSDRRDSSVFKNMKYFTPSILMDVNYNYSFNNPIDNTVVGSTALAHHNEVQLAALHFGGDFNYEDARLLANGAASLQNLYAVNPNYDWLFACSVRFNSPNQ